MPDIPELPMRLKVDAAQARAEFDAIEAQIDRIKSKASGLGAWVAAEIQRTFSDSLTQLSAPPAPIEAPAEPPVEAGENVLDETAPMPAVSSNVVPIEPPPDASEPSAQ